MRSASRGGATPEDSRIYPERPIVSVGAVVLEGNLVLLVKRANEPLRGDWSLPGGAVDVGESLGDAVRREVREETSLEIEVGPIVEVLDRIRREPDGRVRFHYVLVDFVCKPTGGTAHAASDAAEVVWADRATLGRYGIADLTVAVIDKAAALAATTWTPRSRAPHDPE
jgi:ADP-ribose pyrophosphatase YjhB (NUDIX family)